MGLTFSIHSLQHSLDNYLSKEWLETNGLGGQALSSVLLCHTRKYHGLFTVNLPQLGGKHLLVSDIITELFCQKESYKLSTGLYHDNHFHPFGASYLKSFQYDLYPSWTYIIPEQDLELKISLQLLHHENSLLIRYDLIKSQKAVNLRLTPRLAFRHIHTLTKSNSSINVKSFKEQETLNKFLLIKVNPYDGLPSLYFGGCQATYFAAPHWYYNIKYREEEARGFDALEDNYAPGFLEKELKSGETFYLYLSLTPPKEWPEELFGREINYRQNLLRNFPSQDLIRDLRFHSRHFFTTGSDNAEHITAGFPWFGEWGRDTMIALPGLTLYTGQHERAFKVLSNFIAYEKEGLLPNYLPQTKGGEAAYNSIDSSLWFFWTLQEYLKVTGEQKLFHEHFVPVMKRVIEAYLSGRVSCAHLSKEGLIFAGDEATQLTWMDAMVDGIPITPRHGYAVEINALWYNALSFYLDICPNLSQKEYDRLNDLRERCKEAFLKTFWSEEKGYLADSVTNDYQDFSLRPNQIFAVSLPYSPLSERKMKLVVEKVERYLVTPYGMRTLSPEDLRYRSHYEGDSKERDASYHQGTVWPWPLGHFTDAALKVAIDRSQKAKDLLLRFSPLFTTHLQEHGLFSIAEIFDGDPPHRPNGCPAQAWSVAEMIRTYTTLFNISKRKSS